MSRKIDPIDHTDLVLAEHALEVSTLLLKRRTFFTAYFFKRAGLYSGADVLVGNSPWKACREHL